MAINKWLGETVRFFVSLMCCGLWIAAAQSALASPQTDADEIVARFVSDDDFEATLSDMWADAYARRLSAVLSTPAVIVKAQGRFIAQLAEATGGPPFERIEKATSDRLAQSWQPAELESLANYMRREPLTSRDLGVDEKVDAPAKADGLDEALDLAVKEVQQDILDLQHSETIRVDAALLSVAMALIGGMAQETQKIDIDLKAPYVTHMLEIDGMFHFANRIARNNLIRELRGCDSSRRTGIVWRKPTPSP